ncbi:hypothetical protein G3R49_02000 [Shewanella sp. WXL01]|uniref:Uncharacterized protein n=1 Tax=Shewanella maritima TaxID=2520507 RepID=A0A411PMU4_9GAMM|nr:hypothetical protein [Shewanella sp. WXL01]QBF84826.1 hypothetical protein EXU30_07315 [Shewanella maritima]
MSRAAIVLLALICFAAHADRWPQIQFPKDAEVNVVADDMLYNGYPMRTWHLRDKQSQMMLASFFKKQWQNKSDKFDARMFNGDYVINSLQRPYLLTARIKQDYQGTIAYIGITKNLDELALKRVDNDFPTPSGSEVMSNIQSTDLYKKGHTLMVKSGKSLSASYHFYREYYQRRGWVEVSSILDNQAGKAALQMSQGANVVDISFFTQESAVIIVANQVKEG